MNQPSVEQAAYNGYRANGQPALSPDQLRVEIARTRAELASTAEALAERFDVPARVRQRLRDSKLLHDRPTLVAAAIAVVGSNVAIWAFRRQRDPR
jgi:hypothetical protein